MSDVVETRSEEFVRLVGEYREPDTDGTRGEAWNLIADFAVENAEFIRDALCAYVAEPQWQPIESAPTDGTNILAIVAGNHPMSGQPFIPEVVKWTEDGWWNCMWGCASDNRGGYEPTHWMPLPPAPSLENEQEQP